jgi:hypothetical protein
MTGSAVLTGAGGGGTGTTDVSLEDAAVEPPAFDAVIVTSIV